MKKTKSNLSKIRLLLLTIFILLLFGCYNKIDEITNQNYLGTDLEGKGYTIFVLDETAKSIAKINIEKGEVVDPFIELVKPASAIVVSGNYIYTTDAATGLVQKISIIGKTIYTYQISLGSDGVSLYDFVADKNFGYITNPVVHKLYRIDLFNFANEAKVENALLKFVEPADYQPRFLEVLGDTLYIVSNSGGAAKWVNKIGISSFDKFANGDYISTSEMYSKFSIMPDSTQVGNIIGMTKSESDDRLYFVSSDGGTKRIIYTRRGAEKSEGALSFSPNGDLSNLIYSGGKLFLDRVRTDSGLYVCELTSLGVPKTPTLNKTAFSYVVSAIGANDDFLAVARKKEGAETKGRLFVYRTSGFEAVSDTVFSAPVGDIPTSIDFW